MSQKKVKRAAKSATTSVAKPRSQAATKPQRQATARPIKAKTETLKAKVSASSSKAKSTEKRPPSATVAKRKPTPKSAAKPISIAKPGLRTTTRKTAAKTVTTPPKAVRKPASVARKSAYKTIQPSTVDALSATAAKATVRFSNADLNDFRSLLLKLRADLVGKVTYLRDSSLQREDGVNHAEDGTDAFDRLFSLERAGGVQKRIYAIDEALRQIDEGTYGICQNCAALIRKPRLLALPFARNCIDCQSASERKPGGLNVPAVPRRFVP